MARLFVKNPIVELDGDEMARVLWRHVKEKLILPYLNVDLQYFDLGVRNRDETKNNVTILAAHRILQHKVGVKCATITPDSDQTAKLQLKNSLKSPNTIICNIMDGTVFREPIIFKNVPRLVPSWTSPIIIARHAFADQYNAIDLQIPRAGTVQMIFTPADGALNIDSYQYRLPGPGVILCMFNLDESIKEFARACFRHAIAKNMPLYFTTRDDLLEQYDGRFRDIFEQIFNNEFYREFRKRNLSYKHHSTNDMAAIALRSNGRFVWACKNYDGDVQSDTIAQGFGSLGTMTSLLFAPGEKAVQSEAAHGTITRHHQDHLRGMSTSTNPIATIFAWTRALFYRGLYDDTPDVTEFTQNLEGICIETVEAGYMTKDLAVRIDPSAPWLSTQQFLDKVEFGIKKVMRTFH